MSPSKRYAEVLTPSTLECDLVGKQGHYLGGEKVIVEKGGFLTQKAWCPYEMKEASVETQTQRQKSEQCGHEPRNTWGHQDWKKQGRVLL